MKNVVFHKQESFIEVVWVKIKKSAFQIFTQVCGFPK